MAGLEDYFGPRSRAFENFDIYDVKDEDIRYRRRDLRWDDRREGGLDGISHTPRPDPSNVLTPISSSTMIKDNGDEVAKLKHIKTAVSLSALIAENLLSHPFVVLRRQCQVHNSSERFHLFPVSLLPVLWRLNQSQGLTTLWKGLGSVFMVRGLSLAIEDVISKFTPWPKEFKSHNSCKAHGQHIMLKCLSFAIVTPFYSASLVETVQSDIASEKPGIFDVFREGICRLISWGSPQKGRMLPVWKLVIPSVIFGLLKYLISIMIRNTSSRILQLSYELRHSEKEGAIPKDYLNQSAGQDIELTSSFIALVVSETILYPIETILHRLHLQGTRTIIDNLDSGTQVVPILTDFEGAVDCYDKTLLNEGVAGFYKGFGAVMLQFTAHYFLIKLTKIIVTRAAQIWQQSEPIGQKPSIRDYQESKQPISETNRRYSPNVKDVKLSGRIYDLSEASQDSFEQKRW